LNITYYKAFSGTKLISIDKARKTPQDYNCQSHLVKYIPAYRREEGRVYSVSWNVLTEERKEGFILQKDIYWQIQATENAAYEHRT